MPEKTSEEALRNRAYRDRQSDNYQERHRDFINRPDYFGLRAHGLVVEDLIEPRPPPDASSTYFMPEELDWARRWPSESIWKARKTR